MHVIHVDANKVFDALLSHYETISAIASIVVLPWSFFIVSKQKSSFVDYATKNHPLDVNLLINLV